MSKSKNILLWATAFILMAALAYYQRVSGPTHPISSKITYNQSEVKYKLLRSNNTGENARTFIIAPNKSIEAFAEYKRYKSHDTLSTVKLERAGDSLLFFIPSQPAAGKVQYQIFLQDISGANKQYLTQEPVLIRFKGAVPDWILIIHVIFMFGAMLLAARTVFEALAKSDKSYKYTLITCIFLAVGGLILGPIVQKYAFGAYWTGWPFGTDLTDNKTIASLIVWLFAFYKLKRNPKDFKWVIIAFVVMMIVYLIPHSMLGSELDYTKQIQ